MIGMPGIIREDAEMMGATIPFVFDQLSGSNVLVTGACGSLAASRSTFRVPTTRNPRPWGLPLKNSHLAFCEMQDLKAPAYHPETGSSPFSDDGSEPDGMSIWQHVQANGWRSEPRRKSSGRSTRAGDSRDSRSCRKCSSTAASASWFKVARTRRAILSAGAIADGDCQMRCISMSAVTARRMGAVKRVA